MWKVCVLSSLVLALSSLSVLLIMMYLHAAVYLLHVLSARHLDETGRKCFFALLGNVVFLDFFM